MELRCQASGTYGFGLRRLRYGGAHLKNPSLKLLLASKASGVCDGYIRERQVPTSAATSLEEELAEAAARDAERQAMDEVSWRCAILTLPGSNIGGI